MRMRDILWVSLALFIVSGELLASGLRRAFGQRASYRGRVAGPILAGFSALILALFAFFTHPIPKHFAPLRIPPRLRRAAPHFTLCPSASRPVPLPACPRF